MPIYGGPPGWLSEPLGVVCRQAKRAAAVGGVRSRGDGAGAVPGRHAEPGPLHAQGPRGEQQASQPQQPPHQASQASCMPPPGTHPPAVSKQLADADCMSWGTSVRVLLLAAFLWSTEWRMAVAAGGTGPDPRVLRSLADVTHRRRQGQRPARPLALGGRGGRGGEAAAAATTLHMLPPPSRNMHTHYPFLLPAPHVGGGGRGRQGGAAGPGELAAHLQLALPDAGPAPQGLRGSQVVGQAPPGQPAVVGWMAGGSAGKGGGAPL